MLKQPFGGSIDTKSHIAPRPWHFPNPQPSRSDARAQLVTPHLPDNWRTKPRIALGNRGYQPATKQDDSPRKATSNWTPIGRPIFSCHNSPSAAVATIHRFSQVLALFREALKRTSRKGKKLQPKLRNHFAIQRMQQPLQNVRCFPESAYTESRTHDMLKQCVVCVFNMYVCMHVCMYACMHVCMHDACMYVIYVCNVCM